MSDHPEPTLFFSKHGPGVRHIAGRPPEFRLPILERQPISVAASYDVTTTELRYRRFRRYRYQTLNDDWRAWQLDGTQRVDPESSIVPVYVEE